MPDVVDAGAPDVPGDAGDRAATLPGRLSETGLYASGTSIREAVHEYDVRFALWTDGLSKRRFIELPAGGQVDTSDPDAWVFPVGTKLWKELALDGVRLETRLFQKVGPETWAYVAYVWRADATDADAAPEGVVDVAGTFHDVPDADRCFGCHRGVQDRVLGFSMFQLSAEDRERFVTLGLLPPPTRVADPPGDALQARALGLLHANCGHCHSQEHPLAMSRALRLHLRDGETWMTTGFYRTAIGAMAAHVFDGINTIVVPGEPRSSQLYLRPARRGDEWQMPPFGSERVDDDIVLVLEELIESLSP